MDVAYDLVGKDTFPGSLDCIKPLGLWVSFGNSSGPVPPFEIGILSQKGSLYATRPTLFTHIVTREGLLETATDLIHMVTLGHVKIQVSKTYPMAEAAKRIAIWKAGPRPAPSCWLLITPSQPALRAWRRPGHGLAITPHPVLLPQGRRNGVATSPPSPPLAGEGG